jgi:mRNA interferase YafQ
MDGSKLRTVMDLLIDESPLPVRLRDHPLIGNWKGSRDCHVEPDWVLIYTVSEKHVTFERTGTHADLF